ncbi:hypothetical protein O3G_MSEX010170 [Manduca sexta]|uniref:TIR domain-containing protein n=1 Tax=Manduca sexta TaxID=7130 RepID=A0A921ZGZ6_MANSE|nr:hypothetical protein O3G_MSEX010170 [Manduca sexta]
MQARRWCAALLLMQTLSWLGVSKIIPRPECAPVADCQLIRNYITYEYAQFYFNVSGHEVVFIYHDKTYEVELSCNYIAMDNAMLPRFSTTLSVYVMVVNECALPRSGSIDAAVGALNINILSELTLNKFQEPAVITRTHLTGLQRLQKLVLYGNSNTSLAPGALAALSAASALKFLVLHTVRVPAADLARLPSSLQELELWDMGVASMHLDSSVNLTLLLVIDTHYPVVVNVSNAVALRDLHINTPSTVLTEDALPSSLNSLLLRRWNETHPVPKTRCALLQVLNVIGTDNATYPVSLPDEWLSNCGQLWYLKMESVPISGVLPARMLAKTTALKVITIRNCNLTALPSGLLDDTLNLATLDLSNNQLASLPRVTHSRFQAVVTLSGSLECDCNSYWAAQVFRMKAWRASSSMIFCEKKPVIEVDPDTFTCLDPAKCAKLADSCTCRIRDDIQYKQVVIVHCSGLAEFPRLPQTMDKWILHLPHNNISYIAAADVSPNIVELDLRNNSIKKIDVQASAKLAIVRLQLGGNPIECDCEALKLLAPLFKPDSKLLDRKNVKCENDTQITLTMLKLCTKSSNGLVYLLFLLLLLAFVVTGLLARTAIRLRIKMILMRLGWMSRLLEPADDDRPYDAFVSFAHEDEELVMEQLAARLESGSRPYRLCLHYRDWAPGEWIPAQIAASVRASRRTVAVVSAHYLQSGWALAEIREATAASLQEGVPRLIIVLLDETDRLMLDIDPELRAYVRNNTYVRWHDPWFWEKLKQALPPPREQRSQIAPSLPALARTHDSLTLRTYSPRERHEVKFEHSIGNDVDVELSCNYIAMDNAMLPRFSMIFPVKIVKFRECALPKSESFASAVVALNMTGFSQLILDKFQEPAVITRAHLTGLQRLEKLVLYGNSNTSLAPGALAALSAASALKFLVLRTVRVPAADLARLPSSLQELELWDVGAASMHLDSSFNLKKLNVFDNYYPVVVNVSNAVALRDLNINTPSTVLTEDALPSSLNSLELAGWNETHPVPKTRCAQLEGLVILGTNNDAYPVTLPDEWLSNCGQLTDLEMDSVPISAVLPVRMLANAIRLKTITIRNCNLTALPSGLLDDTLNLITLDLSNNQLTSLPRFAVVTLSGSLECDCNSYWAAQVFRMKAWRASSSMIYCEKKPVIEVDPDTFTCLEPAKCATLADSCTCRIRDDIQYKQVVVVHCSGLAEFPRLPPTTDKWILHLPHNNISYLAAADVSPNIVELDLRNNSIKNIDVQASAKLAFVRLQLGGNPIECDCEALKLLAPLLKPDSKLLDRKDVKCENDAQITLAMLKLCTKSSNGLMYLLFLLLLLAFVVTGLLARTAIRLRIKMILMRLGWMSRLLEPADDDRPYDAFVSFAHEDEELVMEQLAARLESGSRPYRLCLHYRDWAPGEWIPAQIAASVRASRRTVAVVSAHYLQSGWALAEIREATAASLQEGMPRLIIVLLDETDRLMLDIDPELHAYVRNNTYVRWHDPWFWEKLKQALPPPREQRSPIAPSLPALALSHDSLTLRTYSPRESDPAPAAKPAHTPHETDEPAPGASPCYK